MTPVVRRLRDGDNGRIVLVHGLEDHWSCWAGLARALQPGAEVVALDLPWRAGNDYRWRHGPPAPQVLAAALAEAGPADLLIAHSFGANTLLALQATDPAPAGSVVAVAAMYRPPAATVTWDMFRRAQQSFAAHIADGVRVRLGSRAVARDPDLLAAMVTKALDRVGPFGLITAFEAFVASAELPLDRIAVPTLLLGGGADGTVPAAAAHGLAGRIPDSTVIVTEDFDHFCHVRAPARVAALITGFLAGARVPASRS